MFTNVEEGNSFSSPGSSIRGVFPGKNTGVRKGGCWGLSGKGTQLQRRKEHWSGLPCPSPGELPGLGIEPWCPSLQADALALSHQDPSTTHTYILYMLNYIHL